MGGNVRISTGRRWYRPLIVALAVVFLIEAWLWRHLGPVVDWVVARIPYKDVTEELAARMAGLPPYGALAVFVVPFLVVEPPKLLALYLISHGAIVSGVIIFGFAKVLGVAIMAWIFTSCREPLMRIGWFARAYVWVLSVKAKADALVAPYKAAVKEKVQAMKDTVREWMVRDGGLGSRLLRVASALRRKVSSGAARS